MALCCLLASFFLSLNLIFPVSVKAGNVSYISENLINKEQSSTVMVGSGRTTTFEMENKANLKSVLDCDCGSGSKSCRYNKEIGNICLCEEGYSQRNEKCEKCNCGDRNTKCRFVNDKQICDCKEDYAEKDGKCKYCFCGNKSKGCAFVNGLKYCHCQSDSFERNGRCEDCGCGDSWRVKSCTFNGAGNKICDCSEGYAQRNMTCDAKCKTNRDCLHGGICSYEGNGYFCSCTEEFKGDKCEISEACESMRNACSAIGAVCKYSELSEKAFCECPKNTAFNNKLKRCTDCSCEGNALCSFENGEKTCNCERGYSHNGNKCEECNCGNNSKSCEFKYNLKVCNCDDGYKFSPESGNCERCSCGPNTISCKFEKNLKVCTCAKGYAYYPKSGKCEMCWCDYMGTSCKFSSDKYTRCTCARGYVADRSKDGKNERCKNVSEEFYWMYATFSLIGLLIIVLFSCTVIVCCIRKSSKGAVVIGNKIV